MKKGVVDESKHLDWVGVLIGVVIGGVLMSILITTLDKKISTAVDRNAPECTVVDQKFHVESYDVTGYSRDSWGEALKTHIVQEESTLHCKRTVKQYTGSR
jgi:activator of 2-hydroxyglutaryl-CoA dehydratase